MLINALVMFCIIATPTLEAFSPPGFKVRHTENGGISYINLAQDRQAAERIGWVQRDRPEGPQQYRSLSMLCRDDELGVCVLFDQLGQAAGLQVAVDKKYFSGGFSDMPAGGFANWTTSVNGSTRQFWTSTVYFVASDSADCIESRDPTKFLQESCAYVTGLNGDIIKISTNAEENTMFTRQKCVPGVGVHYFYNMTSSLPCVAKTMMPWFFFMNGRDFGGVGMYMTGKTLSAGQWNWLERWNGTDALEALQDGPSCFYQLGQSPGFVGLKIFVIDNPEEVVC